MRTGFVSSIDQVQSEGMIQLNCDISHRTKLNCDISYHWAKLVKSKESTNIMCGTNNV